MQPWGQLLVLYFKEIGHYAVLHLVEDCSLPWLVHRCVTVFIYRVRGCFYTIRAFHTLNHAVWPQRPSEADCNSMTLNYLSLWTTRETIFVYVTMFLNHVSGTPVAPG